MRNKLRRPLAFLLSAVMIVTMSGTPVHAVADRGQPETGLCEHHAAHTDDCGYTEETPGTPCGHEHTEDCYTEVTECVHEHTPECYPEETEDSVSDNEATPANAEEREPENCPHICDGESGCITEKLDCRHEHDSECGYTESTPGTPCTYVCEICNPQDSGEADEEPETGIIKQEQCSCLTLCTEGQINPDCLVCGAENAGLSDCKGKAEKEDTKQPEDTGICKHHQEHDDACGYQPESEDSEGSPCTYECRICPIEDLIAALPDKVTEDNADEVRGQLDEILALFSVLTEDEQEQIDLSRCYELQGALDEANDPTPLSTGDVDLCSTNTVTLTEAECSGGCQGHKITQSYTQIVRAKILVESGTHNITFSGLNLSPAAVGIMPGGTMNLTLVGTNKIVGSDCGFYVPVGATLVITEQSTGSLDISLGSYATAAGIGGAYYDPNGNDGDFSCGMVVINGGTITAAGRDDSAGIGGASYAPNFGNGGNITITGGHVTATGSDGAPAIGGVKDADSDGSLTLSSADVLAENTTLGAKGTYTINGDPTEDMIVVPELVYTGEILDTSEIRIDDSKTGTATYFGQTFRVQASADGWVLQDLGEVKEGGEYTAVFKKGNKEISKTFTVAQSGTQFVGDGTVKTYKDGTECSDFTADDTITVKATPTATGQAPAKAAARLRGDPTAGQMVVFVGDTQVSAPADVGEDGAYTMTVSAADVLTNGQAGENGKFTLIVKFIGTTNMADAEVPVEVTITRNPLTADMVMLSAESATYNGTEQKPIVTVTGLTVGKDYDVTFQDGFKNAGTYTVTVTGKGIYEGTVKKTFSIGKATPTIVWASDEVTLTYTGQPAAVALVITLVNGETYTGEIHYSWAGVADSLVLPTNAQSYGGIRANNNYTAAKSNGLILYINPADQAAPSAPSATEDNIKDTSITLTTVENAEYSIDGTTWQESPEFAELSPNTQYTFYARLKEDDNHNASPASTGKSITTKKMMLDNASVTVSGTYTYTGAAIVPETGNVTVELNGTTINSDQYTISATDNINAGKATVTVTAAANGNYSGSIRTTFTIGKAALTIKANDQTITYGQSITEGTGQVTATGLCAGDSLSSITLAASTRNVPGGTIELSTAQIQNSSGADVAGNYNITYQPGTLTINKSRPTIAFVGGYDPSKTYDGQTIPNPTAGNLTITGANYADATFEWSAEPKEAGTYTLTASIKETPNTEEASTDSLTVTISKAPMTATGATIQTRPYKPTYHTAEVSGVTFTGLVNGETLALGQDYTAFGNYDDPNAGENKSATILVELKSSAKANNYTLPKDSSVNATGTITKASSSITTAPSATGITYGQALSDSTLTGGTGSVPGAFAWTDSTAKPNAGTAQFEVTFTPTDTNYNSTTTNVSVTVAKATPTLTAPTATAIQYGQKLTDSALTGGTATNPNGSAAIAGSWHWASGNTQPTATGTFPVSFAPSDTANYNTPANVDTSVTVNPAAPKITLTVPAYQVAGEDVIVTCTVENPHDATFKEGIPENITLTYQIGSGTPQTITNGKFSIPAGTKKDTVITVTASTDAVNGKYTAATKTATVTVTDKIPVEISGISVTGRVYNGQPVNYTGTPVVKKLDGTVVTDALVSYTWSSVTAPVNAGDYSLVVAVGGGKYIGSTTIPVVIEQAEIRVTAPSKTIYVGETAPVFSAADCNITGLVQGENLKTPPTVAYAEAPDTSKTGSVTVTASGAEVPEGGNYKDRIVYENGTLTITSKPLPPAKYTITVQAGTGGTASASPTSAEKGTKITLNATPDGGYHFKEWQVISGGVTISNNSFTMPAANVTVKAMFEKDGGTTPPQPAEYSVTFDGNGGTSPAAQTTTGGKLTNLPTSTQSGYSFNGWYTAKTGGDKITLDTIFTSSVTVYAHWTKDSSGGSSGGGNGNSGGSGNGGGSSSGGGSSNGNNGSSGGGSTIVARPDETKPDTPTTSQTKPAAPDKNGNVAVDNGTVQSAINTAKNDAKKNGNTANGVAVVIPVTPKEGQNSFNVTINAQTLNTLVREKVKRLEINIEGVVVGGMDTKLLKWLDTLSANGDVIFRVKKTDPSGLSKEAKAAIGTRPVYDLSLVYLSGGKETPITDFDGHTIAVRLPYAPAKDEKTGSLYAVYVDGKGKVEWLTKSSYDPDLGTVVFETGHFSIYGIGYKNPVPVFTDIKNHWAEDNIIFVASRGLLAGTGNNQFSPDTGMTRGMFVTALGRLAGIDQADYKTGKFTDVKADAYYAPYVNWAAEKGIVNGTSATTFSPDTNITREQMAVIMANYAKKLGYDLPVAHDAVTFADNAQISGWAAKEVKAMQQAGIMAGKGGNRFDPKGTATRAEVATVLRRFVEIVIDPQTAQGWMQSHSGSWQYMKNGKPATGWLQDDKKWYWLDSNGWMFTGGWKQIDGKWYYFYSDGSMAVNTTIDGYTIGSDGARK